VAQLSTVKFEETGEEERGAGSVADEDGRTGTLDGLFEDFGEEDTGFFGFVLLGKDASVPKKREEREGNVPCTARNHCR
jgi:hypothetical protein